ncbi:MAG: hypothetical protein QY322_02050 [bacterium]|nr:MAG: hypothetical protein QY322_02050 [bacterium]
MSTEKITNCNLCEEYGFTCRRANLIERWTGREKIVKLNNSGQEFAHDFTIETCEVVTGEVPAKKYAKLLMKVIGQEILRI